MPADFFQSVTKITTPIGLAALAIAVLYGTLYVLLNRLNFSRQGYRTIKLIVDKASRLALVALVLGIAAFTVPQIVSLFLHPAPKAPELSKAEHLVNDLIHQVQRLRGDYEASETSKHLEMQATDRAATLADQLAAIRDSDLRLGYRLAKYEELAYAELVAADLNSANSQFSLRHARACTEAVRAGFQALDAIRDSDSATLRKWASEDHAADRLNFTNAVCLCSQLLAGGSVDKKAIHDAIDAISPAYAATFPLAASPPVAKVLGLEAAPRKEKQP